MDWFLFIFAFAVAAVAMSTGLSGALLLSAVFIPVLRMDPHVAFGVALMTQTGGFLSGLAAFAAKREVDLRFGAPLLLVSVPVAVASVWVCQTLPSEALKKLLGAFLLLLSTFLLLRERISRQAGRPSGGEAPHRDGAPPAWSGFRYKDGRFWVAGLGGMFLGLTSAGLGEILVPYLLYRKRMAWSQAVGTAVFLVFGTTLAAAGAHVVSYLSMGQSAMLGEVGRMLPSTVPGAVLGAQLGPYLARLGGAQVLGPLFKVGCGLMGLVVLAGTGH